MREGEKKGEGEGERREICVVLCLYDETLNTAYTKE